MCFSSFMTSTVLLYLECKYDTGSWLVELQSEVHCGRERTGAEDESHHLPVHISAGDLFSLFSFILLGWWMQRKRRTVKVKNSSHTDVIVFVDKQLFQTCLCFAGALAEWPVTQRETRSQSMSPLTVWTQEDKEYLEHAIWLAQLPL